MGEDDPVALLFEEDKVNKYWTPYLAKANEITPPVVASGGIKSTTSTKFWGCTFSSARVLDNFQIVSDENTDSSLILGLDGVGTAQDLTINDILGRFGLSPSGLKSPVGPIVTALQKGDALPKFSIDNSQEAKNGSWIITALPDTLVIATALTFQLNEKEVVDFGESVRSALLDTLGIKVPEFKFSPESLPRLRLKNKTFVYNKDGSLGSGSLCELMVQIPCKGFLINLKIDSGGRLGASLLAADAKGGSLANLWDMLSDHPSQSEATPEEGGHGGFFTESKLWCMSAEFPDDPQEKVTFTIGFILGFDIEGQQLSIGLHYNSREKTFTGGLLFKDMFKTRLSPDFDDLTDLPRGELAGLHDYFDLAQHSPFKDLPSSVPTRLTQADIVFRKGGLTESSVFEFSAAMESSSVHTTGNDEGVPFPFVWSGVSVSFRREWGGPSSSGPQTTINVFSSFELEPPSEKYRKGVMSVNFSYVKGSDSSNRTNTPIAPPGATWALTATAEYIQFGSIASFLDPNLNSEALDILGKLSIDSLEVTYTVQDKMASSFLFDCTISMGNLLLRLYYQYATKEATTNNQTAAQLKQARSAADTPNLTPMAIPKDEEKSDQNVTFWRVDAYLDTVQKGATIASIADSIMDNASASIPGFVGGIEVNPPNPSAHLITLHAGKSKKTDKNSKKIVERATFLLSVAISTVEFTFAQVSLREDSGTTTGTSRTTNTKRLLRLSVGKLPFIDSLPVVKELPQPYQELQYMWLPEPPKASTGQALTGGLTRDDVAALNEKLELEGSDNKLYFKSVTRAAEDPNAPIDPTVLLSGHHFIVVQDNKAIIDHIFKPDTKSSDKPPSEVTNGRVANVANVPAERSTPAAEASQSDSTDEAPPSKGAMRKSTPFITIDAVSFQYKHSRLWIFVDGTIALGPLQFSLIGFGVGLNLQNLKLNDLSKALDDIDFQLRGMEVAFDKPPILIAGCFYHDIIERNGQTENAYRGGIAVTVPPYTFVAVGEYAEVTTTSGSFKSVFVFAKLDGPIIDFEFAILRGLRIGFGYNSSVRTPAVEELHDFPLLNNGSSDGSGNHPMKILENMRGGDNPWVQLKSDSYWLAFGFTISSFNIISATAVAMVSFQDGGPIFRIMGNLTCSMPPDPPTPLARLFYVEVDLYAELNFVEDCFKVLAALAPSSFIYVPMARIHGGLALYSFFGRSPHAGDWVFTVGGYHRSFKKPDHYPVVPRVGLDFNIDIISIRGEGYFAITPKAVMAGAMIRCELSIGPVFAWLDAAFDAMVQFEPIHYWVSMHVEVGVECDIPLLFFTIHIRIHLGAYLEIEGPDFGGTAYVDFWFFSFSFDFGARGEGPKPITLQQFYELCEKSGPPDDSAASKATENLNVKLKVSLEDGAFSMPAEDKKPAAATPADPSAVVTADKAAGEGEPDDTGAGVKWFVKGGSFKFRVSSVFALTEAFIETEHSALPRDDNGNLPSQEEQMKKQELMKEVVPRPSVSHLSSMPMKLHADKDGPNGIVSKLAISIRDIDEEDHELPISDFKPSFVVKSMPQALWADPLSAPPDRLSADKGTIDLPMAVTLEAPDPVLAYAKVPAFNATDMAKACAGANQIPQLPAVTQTEVLPLVDEDVSPLDVKWDTMKQTWIDDSTQNLALANDISALCSSVLGWDKLAADATGPNKQQAVPAPDSWKLPVSFPERLVKGTKREALGIQDGLENFYLELPRMTTAAA